MTTTANNGHGSHGHASTSFEVRVLRQQAPGEPSYWERHSVPYERDMNCISVLMKIAAQSRTVDGKAVAPITWDCNCLEEVCGACTMVINGRVRQACTALVDRLLEDSPAEIELRPMTKFPVIRDLMVNRSRMWRALKKVHAWIDVEGYHDAGPGPRISPQEQQQAYPLSECMTCGCCLEACPQYNKIELARREGESEEQFRAREQADFDRSFVGAHAISQVVLFNSHPTGQMEAGERLDALMEPGGLQMCGKAQNCVEVCPKKIPLVTSIARANRAATWHGIKSFFDS